ncbi:PBP1A family penicillin-binding protein [Caldicoprobacter algeriensis]|uniref:transglycosylase domain-containing protein n=1 Tax=Caldicoprobacter algeriensis TaxID=699281 RepID=UPI00207B049F|nr:PBP1A family penicillin-binding protein [Caldicoprobacter algeriensis]MCM8900837.1 PBP1A family penicillin-binding protein [Caldicoprobacter algeriensis]
MNQHEPIPSRMSRKRKKNRRSLYRSIAIGLLSFAITGLMSAAVYFSIIISQLKGIDLSKIENIEQSSFIYDMNDDFITSIYGLENRIKVSLSEIPDHVKNAFIAVEDIRFYRHHGFDIKRLFGALFQNIKQGRYAEGASTITQQVVRNAFLTQKKTIHRKLQEIYLAYRLERLYSKDQILQMYLNLIYFGKGTYGIEAASRLYFGKSAKDLTVAEAALLAGIPKSPSKYSPFNNMEESLKRKDLVINLMVKYGYLSPKEGEKAKAEKLVFAKPSPRSYPHRFFMDMVLEEAADILGISEEALLTQGYRIYTTLDRELQKYVEEVYSDDQLFPRCPASGIPCESALVILDVPSGEIRTIIGGREYLNGSIIQKGLNRAIQMPKQPGSTIKPLLVYGPAIEYFGYTPATFVLDAETQFGDYKPSNFGGRYRGWVTVREALADSINVPAVRILKDIGIQNGISFAEKFGIPFAEQDRYSLPIALGGFYKGVTPIQLARAYAALADNGRYKDYTTIRRIENSYGITVYQSKPVKKQIMSEESAFILNDILRSAVESGTATRLKDLNIPLAAKTGTVELPDTAQFAGIDGVKDAWIVAYNPQYVITVWMGYDNVDKQHYLPPDAVGGKYPAEVAKAIFRYIYQDKKAPDFRRPANIIEVKLDAKALKEQRKALLASPLTPPAYVITEYFTPETAPTQQSDYWVPPQAPSDFKVTLNDAGLPVISFKPQDTFAAYNIYRLEKDKNIPLLIHQVKTGTFDTVEWVDTLVNRGKEYTYFIVPIHPELEMEGQPLQGTPTAHLSIKVPSSAEPNSAPQPESTSENTDRVNMAPQQSRKKTVHLRLLD